MDNLKGKKKIGEELAALLAAACMTALTGTAAWAETETAGPQITVRSEAVAEARVQELPLPEDTCIRQGREYQLKSYQQIAVSLPEIVKNVQKTVLYEGVEAAAEIPEFLEEDLQDEESGRSASVRLPLQSTVKSNGRWAEGFTFPVTVWGYDAGSFVLGGETVPVAETHPFAGHEEALLELIGVDPVSYRIDSAEWSGEPETGEDGLVYRRAEASGRKYLSDVEAVYGGEAVIPAQPGIAYEAVYVLKEEETEEPQTVAEETEQPVEMTAAPVPAAAAPEEEEPEEPESAPVFLLRLRQVTTVVVGAGILLIPALYFLIRRKRRRNRD